MQQKKIGRHQRPPLDAAVTVQKEWKIHDFYGKYHLSRVKNVAPVPGTALAIEKYENDLKARDTKRFEDQLEQRALAYRKTVRARAVGAEESTKLHIEAVIGSQIDATDATLHQRDQERTKKNYFSDSPDQIRRFKTNVLKNRPHYVGYAVISTGFKSMAWQDEETGDSFVHMAVKNGYVELLEQLLKYNADANLINKMGCAPLHEAWYQWQPPPNTAAVREAQEAKTCAMLRHLLAYNAYPDNLHKTDGNTALHIAARLGPVKAVVILLGFMADHNIRNKRGLTPLDEALAHNQADAAKVLTNWNVMKKQSQHEDFKLLWARFIADPTIPMSVQPDASTVLYKLRMRESVSQLGKIGGQDFMIDDPLIQRARMESILCDQDVPLKPWDKKYQAARSRKISGVQMPKGRYLGETSPSRPSSRMQEASNENGGMSDSRPGTVDKKSDEESVIVIERAASRASSRLKRRPISNLYAYIINENRPRTAVFNETQSVASISQPGSDLEGCVSEVPSVLTGEDFDEECDGIANVSKGPTERSNSAIRARRLAQAHRIARDAKFELCTTRPCTSSAIMISRRSQNAPLFGTEEQKTLERFLSSKSYERPKSPPRVQNLTDDVGTGRSIGKVKENFNRPPMTPMGSYRPVAVSEVYSDNEKLYKRLQSVDFYAAKKRAEATMNSLDFKSSSVTDERRGTMVPMINARARSIADRIVPPLKPLSNTDKLKLDTEGVKDIDTVPRRVSHGKIEKKSGGSASSSPSKVSVVEYGANRLKSSYMTSQPIQTPWNSVSATYSLNTPV